MTFRPNMTSFTQGIRATDALRFRAWNGMVADLWAAEGQAGGEGHYVSPDPRLVVFLDPVEIELCTSARFDRLRPSRVSFIPAGMPIWSRFRTGQQFRHLDLHFDALRLAAMVGELPSVPVLRNATVPILTLAGLVAQEIDGDPRHDLYGEGLVQAMLAEVLALPPAVADKGGLTPSQLRRVNDYLADRLDQRVAVADLAAVAGLSESWFAHAFKQATGVPPHRWQLRLRVDRAQALLTRGLPLAEIAARTGFSDQAHLTRSFRAMTGTTPAAWRRQL